MTIPIANLVPIQESLRYEKQIPGMEKFVRGEGHFSKELITAHLPNSATSHHLIQITRFEDGEFFIADGHHRAVSIYRGGRDHIHDSEYEVTDWKYQDYKDIVFLNPDGTWMGWVTPFDPWKEVRIADLCNFKLAVKKMYYEQSPTHAEDYIRTLKHLYAKPRKIFTVAELAEIYEKNL